MNKMKQGLFSVSYAGLWGQAKLDLLSFLDKAAELGFDGVLLMAKRPHLSPLDADQALIRDIKERLLQNRLKLIGLAAYNDLLLPASSEIPVCEMQISYIEDCARITAQLGGELVRIFTGYERQERSFFSQWDQLVTILKECAYRAARYGVKLAIQNHHDLAVDSKSLNLLLSEINQPNVGLGYDAWSPFLRGENLYGGAREAASHMELTIVADYIRLSRYSYQANLVNYTRVEPDFARATMVGKGEIDYCSFFKGLRDGGYDGWVVYEMCSPLIGGPTMENLDLHARGFLEFMNQSQG